MNRVPAGSGRTRPIASVWAEWLASDLTSKHHPRLSGLQSSPSRLGVRQIDNRRSGPVLRLLEYAPCAARFDPPRARRAAVDLALNLSG